VGPASQPGSVLVFEEQAEAAGLTFRHFNGRTGQLYFVENMGAGVGLVDVDRDGDLDVVAIQGRPLAPVAEGSRLGQGEQKPSTLGTRLFRNEGPDASGRPRFVDATAGSGLGAVDYGMGVASADYDGDGWPDLYLTNFGANRLLRNRGDGTFEERTAAAGVEDERWSTAAVFFDYDRDGRLDLYVGNYVAFRVEDHAPCRAASGQVDYCGPDAYRPEPDRLFRGRGDGTFEDVTEKAGLASEIGPALGAVAADLDGDGWPDLYVGNDQTPNFFWRNLRDGTFRQDALAAGCAVNREGRAEASMGIEAQDFEYGFDSTSASDRAGGGDGSLDLFLTHMSGESNTLYRNDGQGIFRDHSYESGLGGPSLPCTGFGTAAADFDGDGDLDLFVANGAVRTIEAQRRQGNLYPLLEPNSFYENLGSARFRAAPAVLGPASALEEVSRGVAVGDIDNDGDADFLLSNNSGPLRLFLNRSRPPAPWLGLQLLGRQGAGDRLGAQVEITLGDGRTLRRRSRTDGSYLSANDPRILLALPAAAVVASVRVRWPDGSLEAWPPPPLNTYTTFHQGEGLRPGQGPLQSAGSPESP
jgi:hypothetical protein